MNAGAARACRADRRVSNLGSSIPRELKRVWSSLPSKTRGRLRRRWRHAQAERRALGELKWELHHRAQQQKAPESIGSGL